jgi:Zn-dependent protease
MELTMGNGGDVLTERALLMIPLILSLTVHEWAHAWAAWKLGDDTARLLGRLTLNPLAHMDPIGTFLLPLIGIPFGWAKPVPINPNRFSRKVGMSRGLMLTAAAGPISNLILATIGSGILFTISRTHPEYLSRNENLGSLLSFFILMNVLLAVFNCLPIPPLDGSRIADSLMPRRWRAGWDQFCSLGPLLLTAVIVLPIMMGFSLFAWPIELTMRFIFWLSHAA